MRALVIDTATAAVTAAVAVVDDDVTLLASAVTVDPRAHGELLAPSIDRCLSEAGLTPADIGAVAVGLGPGPFTGLRVGLVTAAVFGEARGVPTYGVCSLDAIAGAVDHGGTLLVATDALRKEVYWATYVDGARVEGPSVGRPADLVVSATAMTGSGARLYRDVLDRPLLDVDYPSPLAIARGAAERIRRHAPGEKLVPLYLRRPDAVVPGPAKPVIA